MLYLSILFIGSFTLVFMYLVLHKLFVKPQYIDRLNLEHKMTVTVDLPKWQQKKYTTLMSGIASKLPSKRNSKTAKLLLRANVSFSAEELVIYKILFAAGLGFSVFVLTSNYIWTGLVVFMIWYLPTLWLKNKAKSRLKDFNDQLNSGLSLMSNALKAGHSFNQAIALSAKETAGSYSEEFKVLLKELNFGLAIEDAFANMSDRMPSLDLKLLINAILIQKDVGGNLSEILDNISTTIRDRQKLQNEMKTLTAQGKMSGGIVMFMPVVLGLVIYVFNPSYIALLFQTKVGLAMLGLCVFNEFLGMMIIRKIIKIDL